MPQSLSHEPHNYQLRGFLLSPKGCPRLAGTAVLTPDGIDSQITATEAAQLCGVALCTITKWARDGRIQPTGINEQGRKVYRLLDIAKAEYATRKKARR
jgi:hypothetical protein